jgi:hypothetical protein
MGKILFTEGLVAGMSTALNKGPPFEEDGDTVKVVVDGDPIRCRIVYEESHCKSCYLLSIETTIANSAIRLLILPAMVLNARGMAKLPSVSNVTASSTSGCHNNKTPRLIPHHRPSATAARKPAMTMTCYGKHDALPSYFNHMRADVENSLRCS